MILIKTFIWEYIKTLDNSSLLSNVDFGRFLFAHKIVDSGSHLLEVVFEGTKRDIEIVAAFFQRHEPKCRDKIH